MVHRLASHARRNLVAYVALIAALAAAGGVAYSSIPDAQGVIHGCYDNTVARSCDRYRRATCALAVRPRSTGTSRANPGPPAIPAFPGPLA